MRCLQVWAFCCPACSWCWSRSWPTKGRTCASSSSSSRCMIVFLVSQAFVLARSVRRRDPMVDQRSTSQSVEHMRTSERAVPSWVQAAGGLECSCSRSVVALFLGFYRNQWSVVREKRFKEFQLDSESLVIARMVESRQHGILSHNALLGLGRRRSQRSKSERLRSSIRRLSLGRQVLAPIPCTSPPAERRLCSSVSSTRSARLLRRSNCATSAPWLRCFLPS